MLRTCRCARHAPLVEKAARCRRDGRGLRASAAVAAAAAVEPPTRGHSREAHRCCARIASALSLTRKDRLRPLAQIMESSQTLLHVLKRESVNLTKKKQSSS